MATRKVNEGTTLLPNQKVNKTETVTAREVKTEPTQLQIEVKPSYDKITRGIVVGYLDHNTYPNEYTGASPLLYRDGKTLYSKILGNLNGMSLSKFLDKSKEVINKHPFHSFELFTECERYSAEEITDFVNR